MTQKFSPIHPKLVDFLVCHNARDTTKLVYIRPASITGLGDPDTFGGGCNVATPGAMYVVAETVSQVVDSLLSMGYQFAWCVELPAEATAPMATSLDTPETSTRECVLGLLSVSNIYLTWDMVAGWTPDQRRQAHEWAYLYTTTPDTEPVPARPAFVLHAGAGVLDLQQIQTDLNANETIDG